MSERLPETPKQVYNAFFSCESNKMQMVMWQKKARIYVQLMRADKPIGTWLLLWPTLWALWLAADGKPDFISVLAFSAGTFLMRSAGCVANDWADKDFDAHVTRTQLRPFATGAVTSKEAAILIAVLCGLAVLCLLPFNALTWLMSLPALFLAMTYPFMKRFFPIPQLYLGFAFSFGIPMAFAATQNQVPLLAWLLFLANVFWTLAYDTFYAMADKPDDLKIGMKTSAITFGDWDAEIAMLCHALFDVLMLCIGLKIGATWPFWLGWLTVIYCQWQQYQNVMGRDRHACFAMFLANHTIGWIWFTALVAHFALL